MVSVVPLTSSTYQWPGPQHPSTACLALLSCRVCSVLHCPSTLRSCEDVHNRSNVAYAFLNFISPKEATGLTVTSGTGWTPAPTHFRASWQAENFRNEFHGRQFHRVRSRKAGLLAKAADRREPDEINAKSYWTPVCPIESDSKILSDLLPVGFVQETYVFLKLPLVKCVSNVAATVYHPAQLLSLHSAASHSRQPTTSACVGLCNCHSVLLPIPPFCLDDFAAHIGVNAAAWQFQCQCATAHVVDSALSEGHAD